MIRYIFGSLMLFGFFTFAFMVSNPSGIKKATSEDSQELSSTSSQFEDVTANSGIPKIQTSAIVFGDYDNDGRVDMLTGIHLFRNISDANKIRFIEVTKSVGLDGLKGLPLFADVDNNGLLDIITNAGMVFLQTSAGNFINSTASMKLSLPEHVVSLGIADFNNDGWIDVLVGLGEPKFGIPPMPPRLFMNLGGKGFFEATPKVFYEKPAYLRSIAVSDYDNNGKVDAYFSVYRIRPNNLYTFGKNDQTQIGQRILFDKAPSLNIQGIYEPKKYYDERHKRNYGPTYGHTIASIWTDLDNDGNLDLWVSNLVHKFVGINSKGVDDIRGYLCDDSKIYRNTGAPDYKFVDMRPTSGIPYRPIGDYTKYRNDELWAQTTAADYDNDGFLDVYISQVYDYYYSYSLLYKNLGGFKFKEVSAEQGTRVFNSYAAAWADLNNDGKMDLVQSGNLKNREEGSIRILKNIVNNDNSFLRVKLKGTKSGTQAVTTQVRVYSQEKVFLRQVDGVTGTHNQQNDPTLHFGLGGIKEISKVEVRWPSGKVQTLNKVGINQTIKLEEPR